MSAAPLGRAAIAPPTPWGRAGPTRGRRLEASMAPAALNRWRRDPRDFAGPRPATWSRRRAGAHGAAAPPAAAAARMREGTGGDGAQCRVSGCLTDPGSGGEGRPTRTGTKPTRLTENICRRSSPLVPPPGRRARSERRRPLLQKRPLPRPSSGTAARAPLVCPSLSAVAAL